MASESCLHAVLSALSVVLRAAPCYAMTCYEMLSRDVHCLASRRTSLPNPCVPCGTLVCSVAHLRCLTDRCIGSVFSLTHVQYLMQRYLAFATLWRVTVVSYEYGIDARACAHATTANLCTNIMDSRGFDSNIILMLRGGILMSIANFPESLSQRIWVGIVLVGRLGVLAWRAAPRQVLHESNTSSIYITNELMLANDST